MKAIGLPEFGSVDKFTVYELPTPTILDTQLLIKVTHAGIGKWDVFEREGFLAGSYPGNPAFPYILGSEGSGHVMAVGKKVKGFKKGDAVYGIVAARSPKAGFNAQYVAVEANSVWKVPSHMILQEAGALAIDGGTALRGLKDILNVKAGDKVVIVGASGGMGHLAIQIAKQMGAYVFAVASGQDGVSLAEQLGADEAVDGKATDGLITIPKDTSAVLLTAENAQVTNAIRRHNIRAAAPNGVMLSDDLAPKVEYYNAEYDDQLMNTLYSIGSAGKLHVHIAHHVPLESVAEAHNLLGAHHIGRIILDV